MDEIVNALRVKHAEATDRVGRLTERLNACGPKGNHAVESELDYWQGKMHAFDEAVKVALDALVASR